MALVPGLLHRLRKKARKGMRGYPVATIAWYGPDDRRASKASVGIVPGEGQEVIALQRWASETNDVRYDDGIIREMLAFIESHGARTIALSPAIIGCPHEEGIDYPEGEECPRCPFWRGRDRWTGKLLS